MTEVALRADRHGSEELTDDLPVWAPVGLAVLVSLGVAGTLWVSSHLEGDPALHDAALFGHLACLVLGFGAVLAVDWVALLWLLRRRALDDLLRAADTAHVPIWLGYAGLVLTGMLLEPDLANPATQAKLALVLLVGWNGALAMSLRTPLARLAGRAPAGRVLLVSAVCAGVSQVGWWGAMLLGFLNGR